MILRIMRGVCLLLIGGVTAGSLASAELPPPFSSLNTSDTDLAFSGMELFNRARFNLWSAQGSTEINENLLNRAAADFESISNPAAESYFMSRVELYRGRLALETESKRIARSYFVNSMNLAKKSLTQVESSEALRVLADAGSSWMITKGLGGIIKMAPQVQQWSSRSLEIDSQNALALIINTQGQINAPKNAGGNPEEAIRRLTTLISRTDLDNIERFWAEISLYQANKKLKRREQAEIWYESAEQIFPNSPFLEK